MRCGAAARDGRRWRGIAPMPRRRTQGPSKLVQSVAQAMLKDLDANRAAYQKDPSKVERAGREVPAAALRHASTRRGWCSASTGATATPEQRKRFVDAFYQSLLQQLRQRAGRLHRRQLKVLPSKVDADAESRHRAHRGQAQQRHAHPGELHAAQDADGWKAWDVVIEGISYVKSFREDFGAEIDQKGLDAVIERIEKGGKPIPGRRRQEDLMHCASDDRRGRQRVAGSHRGPGRAHVRSRRERASEAASRVLDESAAQASRSGLRGRVGIRQCRACHAPDWLARRRSAAQRCSSRTCRPRFTRSRSISDLDDAGVAQRLSSCWAPA